MTASGTGTILLSQRLARRTGTAARGEPTKTVSPEENDHNDRPFPLTASDRETLATEDEDYPHITWENLKEILANNSRESKRRPSELRRYLAWSHKIKRQYGGIAAFVIAERLHWTPSAPKPSDTPGTTAPPTFEHFSPIPFADPRDYAILLNDWPYGFEEGISHFIVWSKTPIEVDRESLDVTEESRRVIGEFVKRTFTDELNEGLERVLWFKNLVNSQSVRGVDHVHVLVRGATGEQIRKWCERTDI